MKYFALLLLAVLLSACETSEEDRNFFYNGWLRPEHDANRRIYGGDMDHEKTPPPPSQSPSQ